ncbi:hypothetical protein niasHT_019286 [Heterodera trifolii]|uniref:G-protein coupled receptors family 1 profile domain-containing protein n=1 Tax=Heterodera trifolii TaxID=157864 RepID=A0ABD2L9Z9_9BILA
MSLNTTQPSQQQQLTYVELVHQNGEQHTLAMWLFMGEKCALSSVGILFNAILVASTVKSKNLRSMCNLLIALDSAFLALYQLNALITLLLPIVGTNFVPISLCFYLQFLPYFGVLMSICLMFQIGLERLSNVLFPIWSKNGNSKRFHAILLLISTMSNCYLMWLQYEMVDGNNSTVSSCVTASANAPTLYYFNHLYRAEINALLVSIDIKKSASNAQQQQHINPIALNVVTRHNNWTVSTPLNLNEILETVAELQQIRKSIKDWAEEQTQQTLAKLADKLAYLKKLAENWQFEMSIGNSMVHQRLVKPTKIAMRYCKQLLNGNDDFKRKATDELLDSQLVRIKLTISELPAELGTLRVQLEAEDMLAMPQRLASLKQHCANIEHSLVSAAYCSIDRFQTARDRLLSFAEQLEKDGLGQNDEGIAMIGEATEEFVVGLKLGILEAEFRHKIAAFADPCIYGEAFAKLSEQIAYELEGIYDMCKTCQNATILMNIREQLLNFVSLAREQSVPLQKKIEQKLDEILEKTKHDLEQLKDLYKTNQIGGKTEIESDDDHPIKTFQNLLAEMQIIGIQHDEINQTIKYLEMKKNELGKINNVEMVDQIILIIEEMFKEQKEVISGAYQFKKALISENCSGNGITGNN